MVELVDKFDMRSLIQERFSKEKIVKKDNISRKIVLPLNKAINISMENITKIGDYCGVYILFTRSGGTYVGNSKNIRKRILFHRSKYLFDQIDEIIIYITEDIESARKLKKIVIMDVRPDLNNRYYNYIMDNSVRYVVNLFRNSKN